MRSQVHAFVLVVSPLHPQPQAALRVAVVSVESEQPQLQAALSCAWSETVMS